MLRRDLGAEHCEGLAQRLIVDQHQRVGVVWREVLHGLLGVAAMPRPGTASAQRPTPTRR